MCLVLNKTCSTLFLWDLFGNCMMVMLIFGIIYCSYNFNKYTIFCFFGGRRRPHGRMSKDQVRNRICVSRVEITARTHSAKDRAQHIYYLVCMVRYWNEKDLFPNPHLGLQGFDSAMPRHESKRIHVRTCILQDRFWIGALQRDKSRDLMHGN